MTRNDDARTAVERLLRNALPADTVIVPRSERLRELKARASADALTDGERDAAVAEWVAEIRQMAAAERERTSPTTSDRPVAARPTDTDG
jgi:hypothetical protein